MRTLHPLHHVGYWVDDLDEAVDRAVRTLGVGPFLVHRHVRFESFRLADGTEITDPAYLDHTRGLRLLGPDRPGARPRSTPPTRTSSRRTASGPATSAT